MSVAAMFKTDNLSDLSKPALDIASIDQSALYLLAAKSTPQEVRREVLERAYQGEPMTHAKVKQIVQAQKTKKRPAIKTKRSTPKPTTKLAVGTWVQVHTKEGNEHWDNLIGEIVQPKEFGKFGVKLNETNWQCLRFYPEELTVVPAPPPYKPGNTVLIAVPKKVNCDYKRYNGCWAVVNSISTSGNVEVVIAGKRMTVMNSDIESLDNPPATFKEVAQKISQLLGLEELDDMDRQALEFLTRKQVFSEKQLYRLGQIWNDYFNNEAS